jgi:Uma2 family endonuclease
MAEAARREDWPRTVEEFEAWHARQPERWEFIGGQPRLMAPASMKHAIIKNNVGFALRQALADLGCTALIDGPQILTDEISAIPDVVVTCAPVDLSTPVIAEPVLIVEVMSPSSEADDAGRKWFSYRKLPSLKHYLVLSQDERAVQVHSRAGDLWRERFIGAGALELDDPPLRLEVDAIYAGTELAA